MPRAKPDPINAPLHDVSDAGHLIHHWSTAVTLQLSRLRTTEHLQVDAQLGVIAHSNLIRSCQMLLRHDVPGVQDALDEFHSAHPQARSLRNAIEHFDEYLRGQGNAARTIEWFVYRVQRRDGTVWMTIPPLDDAPAADVDLTGLLVDSGVAAQQITRALHADDERRLRAGIQAKRDGSQPHG